MMEGVGQEAASLAGHLKLDNLCWIYDSNRITIEGSTSLAFSDDVGTRFKGYGWDVVQVPDANDLDALDQALREGQGTRDKPTILIVQSHIGYGATHQAGHEAPRTASHSARKRSGSRSASTDGPRTRSSSCPTECVSTFAAGSVPVERSCEPSG
jgi:transketolase